MSETCKKCGGIKGTIFINASAATTTSYQPLGINPCNTYPFPATSMLLLCRCPSEKHDGKLDDGSNWGTSAEVGFRPEVLNGDIEISGGYGDIECSNTFLDAKQALSLLAWLLQERPRLEEMARELKEDN